MGRKGERGGRNKVPFPVQISRILVSQYQEVHQPEYAFERKGASIQSTGNSRKVPSESDMHAFGENITPVLNSSTFDVEDPACLRRNERSPPIGHVRAHTYIPDACVRGGATAEEEATRPSLPAGRRALGEHLLTGEGEERKGRSKEPCSVEARRRRGREGGKLRRRRKVLH